MLNKFIGSQTVNWPNLSVLGATLGERVHIPLHVLLTIPMFMRLYLVARFMVLNSSIHKVN